MKNRSRSRVALITISVVLFLGLAYGAGANRGAFRKGLEGAAKELYEKGEKAADAENFAEALGYFEKAAEAAPEDPDVLNMLAYSQRKLGKIDEALENYHHALELRPEFPEAREYLGEAYIQAALREIEILGSYGSEAEEPREELIEAFKKAAAGLE